jgi:hypothetical protein
MSAPKYGQLERCRMNSLQQCLAGVSLVK